jgi:cytidine deaminase
MSAIDWEPLKFAAHEARSRAYCPYSGYAVGAAVLGDSGIYAGCNVENVSYGACLCAERNGVTRMIAAGDHKILALALVTQDGGTPCGTCLQVLAEFAKDSLAMPILICDERGAERPTTLGALFPRPFASAQVGNTPRFSTTENDLRM